MNEGNEGNEGKSSQSTLVSGWGWNERKKEVWESVK